MKGFAVQIISYKSQCFHNVGPPLLYTILNPNPNSQIELSTAHSCVLLCLPMLFKSLIFNSISFQSIHQWHESPQYLVHKLMYRLQMLMTW